MLATTQRSAVAVIVAAAGIGQRLGRGPKAMVPIAGRPMLAWALESLAASECVAAMVVVAHHASLPAVRELVAATALDQTTTVVTGGSTRQDSVARGLAAVPSQVAYVAVHDAARPVPGPRLLGRLLDALLQEREPLAGVVPGLPVADTVRQVTDGHWSEGVIERQQLRAIQTPQLFPRKVLEEAYREAERQGLVATDDAGLVEQLGGRIKVIPGHPENFKVTTPHDLLLAEVTIGRARERG